MHLGQCPVCASLAAIAELADAVRAMPEPEPPADLWARITRSESRVPSRSRWRGRIRATAAAAALVFMTAVTTAWITARFAGQREPSVPVVQVVDLDPYLADLLGKRPGQRVDVGEAARQVDFPVVTNPQLSDGYRLEGCCLA